MAIDIESLAPERIRPLRRREFDRLVELGLFDDERVELLEGALIEITPQGGAHSFVTARLGRLLDRAAGTSFVVRQHSPLALSEDSEPEPDIAVIRAEDDGPELPATAVLVIEVAESSLRKDRGIKSRLYAQAQIPEYWLVNLVDRVIEVHRLPDQGQYSQVTQHRGDALVSPLCLPEAMVVVTELVGRS